MNIPGTMNALQLRKLGKLDHVEIPVPQPKPDEILIKTLATTVCTSDLNDMNYNAFGIELPRVLGHEGAGIVATVGEKVSGFCIGDQVTAHPVISCGACESCLRGFGHLCDNMGHLALDRDGTFAEYFCIPSRRARKVPAGVDIAVSALMEPVSVCMEALERSRPAEGETILIVGDGPFGIIIARLAARYKPGKIILVGRHDFRLAQVPQAIGINEKQVDDVLGAIMDESGGRGVDVAVLGAGNAHAMDLCIRSLRPRGRVSVFSAIAEPVPVDLFRVHVKELELIGCCNDQNYLDQALSCLADPAMKMDSIVTHRVPFSDWPRAIDLASKGKDEAVKVAITFDGDAK